MGSQWGRDVECAGSRARVRADRLELNSHEFEQGPRRLSRAGRSPVILCRRSLPCTRVPIRKVRPRCGASSANIKIQPPRERSRAIGRSRSRGGKLGQWVCARVSDVPTPKGLLNSAVAYFHSHGDSANDRAVIASERGGVVRAAL